MKHKYADVIKAWADGKKIQSRSIEYDEPDVIGKWIDETKEDFTPSFNSPLLEFRIKPETLRYRVALCELDGEHYLKLSWNESEAEIYETKQLQFVRWVSEWTEVEV